MSRPTSPSLMQFFKSQILLLNCNGKINHWHSCQGLDWARQRWSAMWAAWVISIHHGEPAILHPHIPSSIADIHSQFEPCRRALGIQWKACTKISSQRSVIQSCQPVPYFLSVTLSQSWRVWLRVWQQQRLCRGGRSPWHHPACFWYWQISTTWGQPHEAAAQAWAMKKAIDQAILFLCYLSFDFQAATSTVGITIDIILLRLPSFWFWVP